MAETFGPYRGRVVAIHDGDTLTFELDLGFGHIAGGLDWHGVPRLSCRVFGINAPELRTQAGKDALVFIRSVVQLGDVCEVVSHGWDKYGGRFDGVVFLPDGRSLGQVMIDAGHAVPLP